LAEVCWCGVIARRIREGCLPTQMLRFSVPRGVTMKRELMMRFPWLICLTILGAPASARNGDMSREAVPIDPIDGLMEAFASHRIVAIDEGVGHGHEQGHAFLRALINDPRLAGLVDDIVVEWGNSLYQDVIDRYTSGREVPHEELRQVWENTTQPHTVWDAPVYREFFRAVRARNATMPEGQRLRVLLGDPPVDWDAVASPRDLAVFSRERDAYPAQLIREQVVNQGRRALVIYGAGHLAKLPRQRNAPVPDDPNLAYASQMLGMRLKSDGIQVFNALGVSIDTVTEVQPTASAWHPVQLTLVRDTILGAAPSQRFIPGADSTPLEEQADALIVYGPRSSVTFGQLTSELCMDGQYVEMRTGRMRVDPTNFIERYCTETPQ
jgi:hypothetical protein